ncbi:hypothetical protein ACWFRJ_39530 [Streptomyces sp. NPDC055239]
MTLDRILASGETTLFDVPTPVEQLLALAGAYSRHNDAIDVVVSARATSGPGDHADSAASLATDTLNVLKAIVDQRLHASEELAQAQIRLRQLAFLSGASAEHGPPMARELTALATDTVMYSAHVVAQQMLRRHPEAQTAPDSRLTVIQHAALEQIACGHVVASSSLGREYNRSREPKVLMSTLRSLEAKHLAERLPHTALPAYHSGPLQDRVYLTPAGITALAAALTQPARRPDTSPSTRHVALSPAVPAAARRL